MFFLFICIVKSFRIQKERNVLEVDSVYFDEQNGSRGFVFIIAIVLNIIGFILYIVFGMIYGSECGDSCCCDVIKHDEKDNSFFSETLKQYELQKEQIEKERNEKGKQNALQYLINTGAIN